MADVRKIVIMFVIAVLFAIFIQFTIEAFYPQPKYEDYCNNQMVPNYAYPIKSPGVAENNITCTRIPEATQEESSNCSNYKGNIDYQYDVYGCPKSYYCNTCNHLMDAATQKYLFFVFMVSCIAGLAAIIAGLYLPVAKNSLNEWIGTGFILGGLISIFVGTIRYFGDLGRYWRPIVIGLEIVLVIWVAYKRIGKKPE